MLRYSVNHLSKSKIEFKAHDIVHTTMLIIYPAKSDNIIFGGHESGVIDINQNGHQIYSARFVVDTANHAISLDRETGYNAYFGDANVPLTWKNLILKSKTFDKAEAISEGAMILNDIAERMHYLPRFNSLHGSNLTTDKINIDFVNDLKKIMSIRNHRAAVLKAING